LNIQLFCTLHATYFSLFLLLRKIQKVIYNKQLCYDIFELYSLLGLGFSFQRQCNRQSISTQQDRKWRPKTSIFVQDIPHFWTNCSFRRYKANQTLRLNEKWIFVLQNPEEIPSKIYRRRKTIFIFFVFHVPIFCFQSAEKRKQMTKVKVFDSGKQLDRIDLYCLSFNLLKISLNFLYAYHIYRDQTSWKIKISSDTVLRFFSWEEHLNLLFTKF